VSSTLVGDGTNFESHRLARIDLIDRSEDDLARYNLVRQPAGLVGLDAFGELHQQFDAFGRSASTVLNSDLVVGLFAGWQWAFWILNAKHKVRDGFDFGDTGRCSRKVAFAHDL